jgi:hypothetical protein
MQAMEGGVGLALLGGAAVIAASGAPSGSVLAASVALYAIVRLALQPLREREGRLAGMSGLRAVSVALLAAALSSMFIRMA